MAGEIDRRYDRKDGLRRTAGKGENMDLLGTHLWMTELIYQAGERIRRAMKQELAIEEKSGFRDLVTNVDRETEDFFRQAIQAKYPAHRIMGEERTEGRFPSLDGFVWIIDPIDGTMNFIRQGDNFGILVSLFQDGEGLLGYIYDVMRDKLCFAVKGQGAYLNGLRLPQAEDKGIDDSLLNIGDPIARSNSPQTRALLSRSLGFRAIGSAALAELSVFEGKTCAYVNFGVNPWDISASFVIGRELGYVYMDIFGREIDLLGETTFIVGTKRAAAEIREILAGMEV